MNIATDTEGEIVAFGVTVPVPTPSMFHDILKKNCDILAQKLYEKVESDDAYTGKCAVLSVPIPVHKEEGDSYFSVQATALRVALEMTSALQMRGYTVLSCTPAAMTDSEAGIDEVSVGYILSVTRNSSVQEVLDSHEQYPMACAWTDYAMGTFGQAAVAQAMEDVKRKILAADNTSVH